jgi:hypothetical protein
MSLKCSNCGQNMPDDNPFTGSEVGAAVEGIGGWSNIDYRATNRQPTLEHRVALRGKPVMLKFVEKIEPVDMPSNEYDRQGETYKAFLIVEVDGHFYRKEAHVDSYGEETWSGPVDLVQRVEKTVQVWE